MVKRPRPPAVLLRAIDADTLPIMTECRVAGIRGYRGGSLEWIGYPCRPSTVYRMFALLI